MPHRARIAGIVVSVAMLAAFAAVAQQAMPMKDGPAKQAAHAGYLTITAGLGERGVFTQATLKDFPHATVTAVNPRTHQKLVYAGVPLFDLLTHLGVPDAKTLMGKALAQYIVATGADGYRTVLSLGEIDPGLHPGTVIVADALNGKPLGDKTGPFRLVISEDTKPIRSVRNLVSIELKGVD